MRLGKSFHQFASSTSLVYQEIQFMIMVGYWILGWFVMSIVVFLRRDFGIRYVSWINLFFGYTAIGAFSFVGNIFMTKEGGHPSKLIFLFYMGFLALSIYHHVHARRKLRAGIKWYTLYSGTPLLLTETGRSFLPFPISQETMNKWIEPAIVATAAVFMHLIGNAPLETWLAISTVALLFHEHISYHMQEQKLFIALDMEIEGEYWLSALKNAPVEKTHGFTISHSNVELMRKIPEIIDAFASLPPDMKAIMDDDQDKTNKRADEDDDASEGVRA